MTAPDAPPPETGALTPEQNEAVERAEQACRYVLKHQEFEREAPDQVGEYERGFSDACHDCERAIRPHVLRHLANAVARTGRDIAPARTNPLDTPQICALVAETLLRVAALYLPESGVDVPSDAEDEAAVRDRLGIAVIDALAPYVAALRLAAWREGVEAAADACRGIAEANEALALSEPEVAISVQFAEAAAVADDCAKAARALLPPAGFAAPAPDGWRTIATAPRDGTPFLAALSNGDGALLWAPHGLQRPRARYLWWRGTTFPDLPVVDTHPPETPFDVVATHWRPFPAMPAARKRETEAGAADEPGEARHVA